MSQFNPNRLALARRRRGLTKTDLATKTGLSAKSVTGYEAGKTEPTAENVGRLAQTLAFPPEFFYLGDPPSLEAGRASFRALTTMTARQRGTALGAGELAIELDQWVEARFERPAPALPDLRNTTPEAAAETVRAAWGLGNRPVSNMIHLLELHGVRVYSLVNESREVNAFSLWWGTQPFVFLNTVKTAERSRFDAAHELGHLILHRHGQPNGREAEGEADRFASSFLMPERDVRARAPQWATDSSIITSKHIWGVSAMALVYRLHTLEMISDWHYHQLCIRFRVRFGSSEPEERPREASQALAKVLNSLRREGTFRRDIARALRIHTKDLDELVFGLVLTSISGNGSAHEGESPVSGSHLKAL
jgi:Zn-dependent peptidase ImmA (M78 family)/DNA-binding XRE family transcriptional regulator